MIINGLVAHAMQIRPCMGTFQPSIGAGRRTRTALRCQRPAATAADHETAWLRRRLHPLRWRDPVLPGGGRSWDGGSLLSTTAPDRSPCQGGGGTQGRPPLVRSIRSDSAADRGHRRRLDRPRKRCPRLERARLGRRQRRHRVGGLGDWGIVRSGRTRGRAAAASVLRCRRPVARRVWNAGGWWNGASVTAASGDRADPMDHCGALHSHRSPPHRRPRHACPRHTGAQWRAPLRAGPQGDAHWPPCRAPCWSRSPSPHRPWTDAPGAPGRPSTVRSRPRCECAGPESGYGRQLFTKRKENRPRLTHRHTHLRPPDAPPERASGGLHMRRSCVLVSPVTPTSHMARTNKPQVRRPPSPAPGSRRTPRDASSGTDRTPAASAACSPPPRSTPGRGPGLPGRRPRRRCGGRPGPRGA